MSSALSTEDSRKHEPAAREGNKTNFETYFSQRAKLCVYWPRNILRSIFCSVPETIRETLDSGEANLEFRRRILEALISYVTYMNFFSTPYQFMKYALP